ncbi:Acyl-CoA dehydrogenase [Saccharopolyspora antimicrobica]|uniref:Acyl-CoA dehydrogenase n=1 Tax=Saccharopolyspora antimicrobica TaxID=455193 RepID=A0A1I4VTP3_9PSEU|nr:acyl-CoA dehydrogenase family protein [Saccharopolyspora antimicrobica]RKT87214.1 alkylation response protein AidB-like acyl-CoA dehydrogenase [Saccharopolyspora antimicrobica]SFN04560.1 Acyl-CoA dehydrogenase [Saccharopolyspora antimicrobica]
MKTSVAPSREELVGRAKDLAPLLSKNALWQEENRILHDDTIQAMTDAGLLKMTLPARYGGYECDTTTLVDVLSEIALGDGAASWTATVWTLSNWLTGLLPDEVQDEVFGSGEVRISGTFAPNAVGVPTSGGVVLNGQWGFNSGARQSSWNAHAAVRVVEGQQPEPVLVLLPMSDLEIVDDWDSTGLRGTGSVTTVAKDVFVPDSRILPMMPVMQEGRHSSVINAGSPLWRVPFLPWACAVTSSTAYGLARAANAAFMERLPTRKITYTDYEHQAHAPLTHIQIAEATARTDEAGFHAHRLATRVDTKAPGEPWSVQDRVTSRLDLGLTIQRAKESVDILNNASGASSVRMTVPIQRIARDIHTSSLHAFAHPDTNLELYGRVACGLEPNTQFL